jgi:hypothetical protein
VAGEAAYVHFAVRKVGVDFLRHLDHVTRFDLGFFLVAGEAVFGMTVSALNAESGGEGPHHLRYFGALRQFENFEVGWRTHRTRRTGLLCLGLLVGFSIGFRGILRHQQGGQRDNRGQEKTHDHILHDPYVTDYVTG